VDNTQPVEGIENSVHIMEEIKMKGWCLVIKNVSDDASAEGRGRQKN